MFRLWGKIWKNNRMAADTVICDDSPDTRTHKVFRLWTRSVTPLISASRSGRYEYPGVSKARKVRFYQDSFIDGIDFDYLEIQVIQEDSYNTDYV